MGLRVTYHCPACHETIYSPVLRPPLRPSIECPRCKRTIGQTKGAIIAGWKTSLFWYGLLPVLLFIALFDPGEWRRQAVDNPATFWLAAVACSFFASALLSQILGAIFGRIVARRLGII